ncbi:hypothetical protein CLIB1423_05S02322 [[Candida] railenensis]|uniref:Arrestin C-terminal-like domain-containing protein n=1 Tax=[Candida] railenensis TaxID=45579 RepID=A0A9P0QNH2_9ASCO|nr:hypothetical protein CLIB1423_05S02322 [[Candida] railenensis]
MVNTNPGVSVSLRASSQSIVHGCPGVPRSIPRIETVVELRPVNGRPFHLRAVVIELRTIQKISVPTTLGSQDTFREYKVYEDVVFSPTVGSFSQELLGVDIPILFTIPREISSSGMAPLWSASVSHRLCVKVFLGNSYNAETTHMETFPVVIKLYDTLPLYRQYNEPLVRQVISPDNQVEVNLLMPITAVGPKDIFSIDVSIKANALHNRVSKFLKLKELTFQIKEILECHEGGLPARKEAKLLSDHKDFSGIKEKLTSSQSIRCQFNVAFPVENDSLHIYDSSRSNNDDTGNFNHNSNYYGNLEYNSQNNITEDAFSGLDGLGSSSSATVTSANIAKYNIMDKLDEGIPLTHVQGFTSSGKLFSLRYEVVLKIKLAHSKDMDLRIPLTVSPFDRKSSAYLLNWIKKECEMAAQLFGREMVNWFIQNESRANDILRKRYLAPPILYKNTRNDWIRLGFNGDAFGGRHPSKMVEYID